MAERRMFTNKITEADEFTALPPTTQCLYFHLCMSADDDGFSNKIRNSMFAAHADVNDFNMLVDKRFIIPFESGVVVIKHWRMHNLIRSDRYHETDYLKEKASLLIKENGSYTERKQDDNQVTTICLPSDNQMEPEVRLGKDSIGKVKGESKSSSRMTRPTIEEVQAYITEKGYHVDAQRFIDYYESNGWKVGRNPMKDWKATVRTWENRDKQDKKNNVPANNKKFRNFEEREYDYDSLEKQLLSKRRG